MSKKYRTSLGSVLIDLVHLLIYAIKLLLKRFLKLEDVFLIALLYLLYLHSQSIVSFLGNIDISVYKLIREYISTLLSLPVTILVIGLIFMKRFKKEIKIFLKNSKIKHFGTTGVSVDSKNENGQSQPELPKNPENVSSIKYTTGTATITKEDIEKEVFFVLAQFLVPNTRNALLWFYNKGATKELFLDTFILEGNFDNPKSERDTIFMVLYNNKLLEISNSGYMVSDRGIRFLKYLGFNTD